MKITRVQEAKQFSHEKAAKTLLGEGTHCRAALWCMEAGQEIHPHTHDGDHVWVVQEGTGWFLADTAERKIGPGSVIFAPEGLPHGMRAETRLVFVSVSAGGHG